MDELTNIQSINTTNIAACIPPSSVRSALGCEDSRPTCTAPAGIPLDLLLRRKFPPLWRQRRRCKVRGGAEEQLRGHDEEHHKRRDASAHESLSVRPTPPECKPQLHWTRAGKNTRTVPELWDGKGGMEGGGGFAPTCRDPSSSSAQGGIPTARRPASRAQPPHPPDIHSPLPPRPALKFLIAAEGQSRGAGDGTE